MKASRCLMCCFPAITKEFAAGGSSSRWHEPGSATQYVSDPALATLLKVRDDAARVQLYFDTAFGTSVGGAMNDAIALMFAGQASPQDIVTATQEAADAEK